MKTKALITGGAGFIGSHLSESLLERGYDVTIIDDLSTGRFENIAHLEGNPNFHYALETITNEGVMDRLVSESDVLFHLAAAVGVDLIVRDPIHTIETNVMGSHVVLQIARRYRRKVLMASTSEIYGKSIKTPFSEDDDRIQGSTTKSRWAYATSKALDEFMALAYYKQVGLPVVVFRLFNTVGPRQSGQYGMVIPRFVQKALAGEPIEVYGTGKQTRCFCNVTDVVRAVSDLAETPDVLGQVYNIGSEEEVTILQLAERIKERAGSSSEIKLITYEEAYDSGFEDMQRRVPDIRKINAAIGWTPTRDLNTTIDEVIAYHRAR